MAQLREGERSVVRETVPPRVLPLSTETVEVGVAQHTSPPGVVARVAVES